METKTKTKRWPTNTFRFLYFVAIVRFIHGWDHGHTEIKSRKTETARLCRHHFIPFYPIEFCVSLRSLVAMTQTMHMHAQHGRAHDRRNNDAKSPYNGKEWNACFLIDMESLYFYTERTHTFTHLYGHRTLPTLSGKTRFPLLCNPCTIRNAHTICTIYHLFKIPQNVKEEEWIASLKNLSCWSLR